MSALAPAPRRPRPPWDRHMHDFQTIRVKPHSPLDMMRRCAAPRRQFNAELHRTIAAYAQIIAAADQGDSLTLARLLREAVEHEREHGLFS